MPAPQTPGPYHCRDPVALVDEHLREVEVKEPADLLGHRGEDLSRRPLSGDQRRDTPERRVLVREQAARLLRRGRAAAGTGRKSADEDRHHEKEAEDEPGRSVEL